VRVVAVSTSTFPPAVVTSCTSSSGEASARASANPSSTFAPGSPMEQSVSMITRTAARESSSAGICAVMT
jgi:hypothetical protein